MGNTLYHYTSFVAFDGIIRGRELRMNNILNMNDAEEMSLFFTGICKALRCRFQNEQDDSSIAIVDEFDEIIQQNISEYPAYAACFSKFRDDAAQWERYARYGKGVCIGFEEDFFRQFQNGGLYAQEVFYLSDLEGHPIVNDIYQRMKSNKKTQEKDAEILDFVSYLWKMSTSFKHSSFRSEQEVRLVFNPQLGNPFGIEPKYHVASDRIKKYYPLQVDILCEMAGCTLEEWVKEIIIGPESTQSPQILRDYLQDNNLGKLADKITLSDCPLRSKL